MWENKRGNLMVHPTKIVFEKPLDNGVVEEVTRKLAEKMGISRQMNYEDVKVTKERPDGVAGCYDWASRLSREDGFGKIGESCYIGKKGQWVCIEGDKDANNTLRVFVTGQGQEMFDEVVKYLKDLGLPVVENDG